MLQIVFFALMLAVVSAQQTPYYTCISPDPIYSYYVEGCTAWPCTIKVGGTIHANIKIVSPVTTTTANLVMTVTVNGVTYPASPLGDMCQYATPKCPITKGTAYTIDFAFPAQLPLGSGWVQGVMTDDKGNMFYCQGILINVVN